VKPEELTGMPYLGDDWSRYEGAYSSRTMADASDAVRFMALVRLLNQASDAEFAARVSDYLDVDAFLRFLACEVVLVNTDSPLAMNRNYWITVHPGTKRVVWIPWDMNMAFAGFKPSDAGLSVYHPTVPGAFPLAERVLAIKEMAARYDRIVREIMATNFTVARLERQVAAIEEVIGDAAAAEHSAIVSKAPPLRPFVVERVKAVTEQLDGKRGGAPARAPMTTPATN
jgi:spore coat protein CotH